MGTELSKRKAAFWNEFRENAQDWAYEMHSGDSQSVLEAIDSVLQSHGFDFCFDLTTDERDCFLIFSPEGDADEALRIDDLLRDSPKVRGWVFVDGRLKKDLDDAAAIVRCLYHVDPLKLRYRLKNEEDARVVCMIVPSSVDLSPEEADGMINTFLWHSVGERRTMAQGIQGRAMFQDNIIVPTSSAKDVVRLLSGDV